MSSLMTLEEELLAQEAAAFERGEKAAREQRLFDRLKTHRVRNLRKHLLSTVSHNAMVTALGARG